MPMAFMKSGDGGMFSKKSDEYKLLSSHANELARALVENAYSINFRDAIGKFVRKDGKAVGFLVMEKTPSGNFIFLDFASGKADKLAYKAGGGDASYMPADARLHGVELSGMVVVGNAKDIAGFLERQRSENRPLCRTVEGFANDGKTSVSVFFAVPQELNYYKQKW